MFSFCQIGISVCFGFSFCLLLSCRSDNQIDNKKDIEKEIRQYVEDWIGTPYKIRGTGSDGIDCSALTRKIYQAVFNVELPRRVVEQRVEGLPFDRDSLLAGDLIVFRAQLFGRPHIFSFQKTILFMPPVVKGLLSPIWRNDIGKEDIKRPEDW